MISRRASSSRLRARWRKPGVLVWVAYCFCRTARDNRPGPRAVTQKQRRSAMKSTSNLLRFDSIFYAVSTSLLLATPVETIAYELQDDPTSPGFLHQPAVPQLSLDPVSASG